MLIASAAILKAQQPISLFPSGAPGETTAMTEKSEIEGNKTGGETVTRLTNVSNPSITIYPASADGINPAMIVCPGGGYNILAYDKEGEEVCQWLNQLGITAVLLKYRVPRREGRAKHEAPLQDAQRAISYVRHHSAQLRIDPARLGIMGFSAGGHLAATTSNSSDRRAYSTIDDIDKTSCRPDFCLLIYPAYLDAPNFGIAPELTISPKTPPTMMIQTEDDKSYIKSSIYYYNALMEAGIPAWMHLYSSGGHGYGLRDTGVAVNQWPDRAEDWFREINIIR
ncbi:MAG: alpha/beta hydrolase [Tannerellaceae bacterium]|nr:alpha/beta hydrolase [Tannerellaceae bacterium]